jgi:hypothetical protein
MVIANAIDYYLEHNITVRFNILILQMLYCIFISRTYCTCMSQTRSKFEIRPSPYIWLLCVKLIDDSPQFCNFSPSSQVSRPIKHFKNIPLLLIWSDPVHRDLTQGGGSEAVPIGVPDTDTKSICLFALVRFPRAIVGTKTTIETHVIRQISIQIRQTSE